MGETRKLAAILVADIVGYSRLAGSDEDRILARLRTLRSDLFDPTIAVHHGRVVKRTGDGSIIEFRSVVDAVRCAIEVQSGLVDRNAGVATDRRIEFRIGIHLGDVVEESDGDLMGDGVNIAARLEGIAQPGGICLSSAAYEQVRDKVKEEFVDLGEKGLKNIARPMRVYAIKTSAESRTPAPHALLPEKQGPPRLSIVVLPFANLGGDPEQDYFVDGVTESLTTDLSRLGGSFVIGRHTAFSYKGKALDLRQIGRELNVRYVLEGSVQRAGNRMRINVQLVDAESGNHLWAERFDKPVADFFDMQDEIVSRLWNQVATELTADMANRAERTPHPDSMDLSFRGWALIHRGLDAPNLLLARGFFERALVLDPGNLRATIGTAVVDLTVAAGYQAEERAARLSAVEMTLTNVLSQAPNNATAVYFMGVVQLWSNRPARAIANFERALALNPNLVDAHGLIGLAKLFDGRAKEVEHHVFEALRLSPRDNFAHTWLLYAGLAKLFLGAYEEAVAWFRRSIEANRNLHVVHIALAVALAQLGRLDEAQRAARDGLALDPNFSIRGFRIAAFSSNPIYLAQRERCIDGMRKAGVPEE
jgi:TolB-like protein/class 3 adenylate cyclase/Flp pilus assembly protein TadD